MDAAMRLPSTPLGQVANPSFNAFFSEYFLMPDKKLDCIWLRTRSGWFIYILQDSAIYSEEKTEFKTAFGNRIGVEF
jgi:hypothetical protein